MNGSRRESKGIIVTRRVNDFDFLHIPRVCSFDKKLLSRLKYAPEEETNTGKFIRGI